MTVTFSRGQANEEKDHEWVVKWERTKVHSTTCRLALLCGVAQAGDIIQITLSPVGDAGNVADPLTGYGSVAYPYSIGTYAVTTGEYAAFSTR